MIMKSKMQYSSAWVIGSAGGIGEALLKNVVCCSNHVYACDVKKINFEQLPAGVDYYEVDCSNEKDFLSFANYAVSVHGAPDLLVVASGYVSSFPLTESTSDEIDKIYQNNFRLVALVMKIFFEKCSKDSTVPKNIIIVSSNAGFVPRPNQPIYAAMKSAINSLVKSQAVIWGAKNIKINAIAPGTVAVPRNLNSLKMKYSRFPLDPTRPLGRIAFPSDLNSVFRLLLEKELLMTGQVIVIDGGNSL